MNEPQLVIPHPLSPSTSTMENPSRGAFTQDYLQRRLCFYPTNTGTHPLSPLWLYKQVLKKHRVTTCHGAVGP